MQHAGYARALESSSFVDVKRLPCFHDVLATPTTLIASRTIALILELLHMQVLIFMGGDFHD